MRRTSNIFDFKRLRRAITSVMRRLGSSAEWRLYRPLRLKYARLHRTRLDGVTFIGITGSAGKTSTKDLVAAILRTENRVRHSSGTANRIFHIAEIIAETRSSDDFCLLELSAERPGYFDQLLALVRPNIGVVTTVGEDQLRRFGSKAAIAAEKGKLVTTLPPDGTAVLNADDPLVMAMAKGFNGSVITFGQGQGADLRATEIRAEWPHRLSFTVNYCGKSYPVQTQFCGKHWVTVVLAALATAAAARVDLEKAVQTIEKAPPGRARMQPVTTNDEVTFIRDDWKAQLWGLPTAFDFMKEARAARKIIVLGTLADYHGDGRSKYQRAGEHALQIADIVIFAGGMATAGLRAQKFAGKNQMLLAFPTIRQASEELGKILQPGDLVLLKGSCAADHLGRLYHAHVGPVDCWRMDCGKDMLCDSCSLLRTEGGENRQVAVKAAPMPEKETRTDVTTKGSAASLVLVGIGNPSEEHRNTPHNVGFTVLDLLAKRFGVRWQEVEDAEIAHLEHEGVPVLMVKPQKQVNNTGKVLCTLAEAFHFLPRNCILVHDDIRMSLGSVRNRLRGSDGGHLGVRSVIVAFQTSDIPRVKIGVKPDREVASPSDYLLSTFSREDSSRMDAAYETAAERLLEIIRRESTEGPAFRQISAAPAESPC